MFKYFLSTNRKKADSNGLRARIRLVLMILVVVCSLVGMSPTSVLAAGTTYYVNKTVACSDAGPGTSGSPYCTIGKGATVALAGDTVQVVAGSYAETVVPSHSGSSGSPITFTANPGVTVTGNGSSAFRVTGTNYIVINGFTISTVVGEGIYLTGTNITVTNNTINNTADHGIFADTVGPVTISNNVTSNSTIGYGIYLKGVTASSTVSGNTSHHNLDGIRLRASNNVTVSDNIAYANIDLTDPPNPKGNGISMLVASNNNTILHNITYANRDSGLQFETSSSNLVLGNITYHNGDHGIDITSGSVNHVVTGNTVQGNHTSGINLELNSTGSTIYNNILVDNGLAPVEGRKSYNLYADDTSYTGTTVDYNLYYLTSPADHQIKWNTTGYSTLALFKASNPTKEVHGVEGNPLFTAPAPYVTDPYAVTLVTGNYHINATSPAIDSANSSATGEPTLDIEGNTRVDDPSVTNTGAGSRLYDDRGAYEFQSGGASTTVDCGAGTPTLTYGASITCVATVAAASGSISPTGNVAWTTSGTGTFTTSPCTLSGSGGSATCSVSYGPSAVGTGSHLVTATYNGDVNFQTSNGNQTVTVNAKALTMSGLSVPASKVYNGTTVAVVSGTAALLAFEPFGSGTTSDGKPYTGDTVSITGTATGTYNSKDVGTGTTVTFGGLSLTGAQAGNYTLTIQSPASATITKKALTMSGLSVPASKVYDGTTAAVVSGTAALQTAEAPGAGNTSDGMPYTGDTVSITGTATGTYNSKNVASATTVTFGGLSLTGGQAGNYTLTMQSPASATITTKALTMSGLSVPSSKVYNGTTAAVVSGTAALQVAEAPGAGTTVDGKPYTGDTVSITGTAVGTYDFKDVATATTVTFSGLSLTGGQAGNYTLTIQSPSSATITAKALTVNGLSVPASKVYNGTTAAVVSGTAALPGPEAPGAGNTSDGKPYTGDTVNISGTAVGTYNSKHVSAATTVTFSGLSLGGAQAGNYTLAALTAPATITAKPITVTAVTNAKLYDGTTAAAAVPTNSGVAPGDTDNFIETYNNKHVGVGNKTLTPSGTVTDGDSGNNYSYTFNSVTTGTITAFPITVNAVTNTKVYDGATTATAIPTNSGVLPGDTANFTEAYADKHVGSGNKTLVPSGTVTDGNSGNNYSYTFNNFTTGTITAKSITVTAVMNTKVYNGTTAAAAIPTNSGVAPGDTANFTEVYLDPNFGIGNKTLIPTGLVSDGNSGNNYAYSYVTFTTGTITAKPITVTANPGQVKTFGTADPVFTYTSSDLTVTFSGAPNRAPGEAVGFYAIGQGTLAVVGNNFTITSFVSNNFEISSKQTPTITASGGPFTYDGASHAAIINGSVPGVVSDVKYNGSTVAPANVGTYSVTADFTPNDTGTYNSLADVLAGSITINKTTLTVTANNQTVVFGNPDPAFTISYSGFVNGETSTVLDTAPTCTVSGPHSALGSYPIVCSGGVDTNYTFNYVNGTLTVNPANSAPTDISLSNSSITENLPANTLVGSLSTTDPDAGDVFTYSFCGGADDASFTISGSSLQSAVAFDADTKSGYSVCIRSTDAGTLSTTKTFAITIINDPTDVQTFKDVPSTYWAYSFIERLYAAGITGGCATSPDLIYCPDSTVTRAQMAVFLLKGMHGSSYTPPAASGAIFTDVPSSYWAAAWIEQLAAEGITGGCGTGVYCPDATVTRAQMAVFLLKAEHGSSYAPPAATGVFTDVPVGYWADKWIEQLALEGITGGCGTGTYCPDSEVTRAQMAVFLVKTFALP